MKVVLLRVGIDTGVGGIHSPLFRDGTFEFIPIPDRRGLDERTYEVLRGRNGQPLLTYFPERLKNRMRHQPVHVDPEFEGFTYGDPTRPKSGLQRLEPGDLLVFYAGLQGWDFHADPALFVIGYFQVEVAGPATGFTSAQLHRQFSTNAHYRNPTVFLSQVDHVVLVKGDATSRILGKAVRISAIGADRAGRRLHVLSPEMQRVFGDFGGRIAIQRSPPRWVHPEYVERAARFVQHLD